MIASLFMYRFPELEAVNNRYWGLIHQRLASLGIDSPVTLSQDGSDLSVWEDPQLLFSQTCGMPYRTWLQDKVDLVGTPDYGIAGCAPGYYRSAIVVRADDSRVRFQDFEHAVLAFNNLHSQSGYAAPYWHAHDRGFWFENRLAAGRHLESARVVAQGRADIAALDAVTWALMQRYADFTRELRVLEWTEPTPGLPYIAAKGARTDLIFEAVSGAITDLSRADRDNLLLKGLARIPDDAYLAIKNPPSQ